MGEPMSGQPEPKLFISYSWSSPDHEAWVVSFAEELVSQGIQVILDKWDLQPGHDANAFMESMVTDPTVTKVILVCDQQYMQKSNSRSGGAGTEAQIITPELYAKKAQDKIVAIIRERDNEGRPYLPVYYGSRIYIDLTNPSTYGAEFDRLVRWAWDQPLHVRPEKGVKPSFLTNPSMPTKIVTAVAFRRAFDGVRNSSSNAPALVAEYFSTLAKGLEAFRINIESEDRTKLDDFIVASIDEFLPYRNEAIEMYSAIAQYSCTNDMMLVVHRFFELLLPYTDRPEHLHSWNDAEFDNFRFIVHELFLYSLGIFLRFEKFDAFSYMVDNEYFWENPSDRNAKMHAYLRFRQHLESLSYRSDRLKLGRASVRADMLRERNKGTGIDFKFVMAADFILYLRSRNSDIWHMWSPETLVHVGRFGGAFELFARAKSTRYFDRIKGLLQVSSKEEFGRAIAKIRSEPDRIPRWGFEKVNIDQLTGFETLATTP
jgi:hypothetical protein